MFADAQVHKSGNQLHVTHGEDAELHVEFRMEAVHQAHESAVQGRPIYADTPFIRIMFPGDRTKTMDRPVTEADKQRFARQWAVFVEQGQNALVGTPITEWPPISKSQAMELKGINVHTVENLAGMNDTACGSILGGRELREKAKSWLAAAKDDSFLTELLEKNGRLETDVAALQEQIKLLQKEHGKGKHTEKAA